MFKFEKDQELTFCRRWEPEAPARVLNRRREEIDGVYVHLYQIEAEGKDTLRNKDGELWVQESELSAEDLFARLDARRREGI